MAEWIFDFFRNNNCRANEIVLFPGVMVAVAKLSPKEKELFTATANELISYGYMSFEQSPTQCLRLSLKGEDYIYDTDAVLDCCGESKTPNEKILRDIIYLGQMVNVLLEHQSLIKSGEPSEIGLLSVDNEAVQLSKVEAPDEYYKILYSFNYSVLMLLSQVDEESLREVLFRYVSLVERILKSRMSTFRIPINSRILDVYNKAVASSKTSGEIQKLQLFKEELFLDEGMLGLN